MSADPRTTRLVDAYEHLTRDSLPALLGLYGEQAAFKDPFNDVRGRTAIARIYEQMFDELCEPRFVVHTAVCEGDDAVLTWTMHFRRASGAAMDIRGATQLRYAPDGLVSLHRDWWDAAEELYAKLPVLGWLMRALQRRLATPQR